MHNEGYGSFAAINRAINILIQNANSTSVQSAVEQYLNAGPSKLKIEEVASALMNNASLIAENAGGVSMQNPDPKIVQLIDLKNILEKIAKSRNMLFGSAVLIVSTIWAHTISLNRRNM